MTEAKERLGVLVRRGRKKRGSSLSKAAAIIGITKTHLWELEKGKTNNPSIKLIWSLMDYCDFRFSQIKRHK